MSEKTLENKIKKHLQQNGHYYIKISASATMKSGIPDIISCIKGYFIAFEVKNPNGKGRVSKLQNAHIDLISKSDGLACVISSWEEYISTYERILYVIQQTRKNIKTNNQ